MPIQLELKALVLYILSILVHELRSSVCQLHLCKDLEQSVILELQVVLQQVWYFFRRYAMHYNVHCMYIHATVVLMHTVVPGP